MQVNANQVVIQLSAAPSAASNGAPVFSVSRTSLGNGEGSGVQISAAARALAEVSGYAARPQLNMFVQLVGAIGGNGRSFVPVSPTANAQARVANDTGEDERAAAIDRAQAEQAARESESAGRSNDAATTASTPVVASSVASAQPAPAAVAAPVGAYQQVASAAPAAGATVDVNV